MESAADICVPWGSSRASELAFRMEALGMYEEAENLRAADASPYGVSDAAIDELEFEVDYYEGAIAECSLGEW